MRRFLISSTLIVIGATAQAQDPGAQAAQQAQIAVQQNQMAAQMAQQANAQAMQDAQLAAQNAQQAAQAAQQASQNAELACCGVAAPSFSRKTGKYSSAFTVTIHASRGAAVYYTTDGWTPTEASTRYTGPITIDSTTTLQAVAVSPSEGRTRVTTAVYTLTGFAPRSSAGHTMSAPQNTPSTVSSAAAAAAASGKLLLARDTPVRLAFSADVTSRTAHVGDKISLTLAQDLKAGDAVIASKGTPSTATITEVETPRMMGAPGEIVFVADSLRADDTVIKLRGTAAKQGQDEVNKARSLFLIPVPVALLVHGKDAEIKPGAVFTAFVDADTLIPVK